MVINEKSLELNIAARKAGEEIIALIESIAEELDEERHQRIMLSTLWEWLKNHPLAKHDRNRLSSPPMPKSMKSVVQGDPVATALTQCEEIINMTGDVPCVGQDFAESVAEKTKAIADNIEQRDRVTEGQQDALDNMQTGVTAWLEH